MIESIRFQLHHLTAEPAVQEPVASPVPRREIWPLVPGPNRVGSDPDNDIHLEARGVSRFHAEIHCGEIGCELEDLRSKNGSQVNGHPVGRRPLKTGDVLLFGNSRWVLATAPAGDVELAFEITASRGPDATAVRATSNLRDDHRGSRGLPYPVLKALLDRLRQRPAPDLQGALLDLAAFLDVHGVAFVEWPERGPATVISAAGSIDALPERAHLTRAESLALDPELKVLNLADASWLVFRQPAGLENPSSPGVIGPGLALFGATPDRVSRPFDLELAASYLLLLEDGEVAGEAGRGGEIVGVQPSVLRLPEGIVAATSGKMASVYTQLAQVADDQVPVMILGETGVGKEHLARALHDASPRREGPFVAVNCAAIPAELLEAEMFGIGRGVATGVQARLGKIREADGGTLFLDEIGDMPAALQAKLLRVLQEGEVTPVGESAIPVDVRLVSASHADPATAIAEGRIRQDLYYRLAGYVLKVPALRERPDDLPVLLGHFLRTYGRDAGRQVRGVTVKAFERLRGQAWPGNVRQLQHVARRLVYLCPPGQAVDSAMVDEALDAIALPARRARGEAFIIGATGLDDHLATLEGGILRRALERTEGNRSKAARLLRISRNSLARRLDRQGIDPKRE